MANTKSKVTLQNGESLEIQVDFDKKTEHKFTKSQIIAAKRYEKNRDALAAILDDDNSYTLQQVNSLLDKFYKGGKK